MIRTLALDPGTNATGYAVLSLANDIELIDHGTIRPKRSLDEFHKWIEIARQVNRIVAAMMTANPGKFFVLVEKFEGAVRRGRSANALKVWGAASACACGAALSHPFDENIVGVAVKDWNSRHLPPEQVMAEMAWKYGATFATEHEAAACAIGGWWLSVKRVELLAEVE